jgi:oligopeptide transport system permease protein
MVKRLLGLITTLAIVVTVTFFLLRLLPGGPFDRDRKVPAAVQAKLEARYHLNQPVWVQYGAYLQQLLKGDLGPSYQYPARSVNALLAEALPVSASVGGLALLVGCGLGVALGLLGSGAMGNHLPWWLQLGLQKLCDLIGVISLATPTYLFGGLLIVVFALWLNVLPAATLITPWHWVLPVLTLSLLPFSFTFMLIRTGMQETQQEWFIRIKQAFGLPQPTIVLKHQLRLAVLPVLSLLGPIMATVLTGSFAVETLFAIPGIGKHFVTAVIARDYTVVMGITLVYSLLLVVFNTLTDWLQTRLDPRLR